MIVSTSRRIPIMLGVIVLLGLLVSALVMASDHRQGDNRIGSKVAVDTQPLITRLPTESAQWGHATLTHEELLGNAVSRWLMAMSLATGSVNGGIENPRQYAMDINEAQISSILHLLIARDMDTGNEPIPEMEKGDSNNPGNVTGNIVYTF